MDAKGLIEQYMGSTGAVCLSEESPQRTGSPYQAVQWPLQGGRTLIVELSISYCSKSNLHSH
jgi:hypothetical protein